MDEVKFDSLNDLYKRILPALKVKNDELNRLGLNNFKEIDIWNYLFQTKWHLMSDLRLNELVNDIFNIDEINLINYYKIKNVDRNEENESR